MKRIKSCKYCGNDIAKNAEVCPFCGGKYRTPFYKKIKFWIFAFVMISLISAVKKNNDIMQKSSCVTEDKYNSIQSGMTYEQVRQKMGCDSVEAVKNELGDSTSYYSRRWYTEDGQKTIYVYFIDGKVSRKYSSAF